MRLPRHLVRLEGPHGLKPAVPFVRGPGNVQLLETSLVIEGEIYKATFLGAERLLAASLGDWTTVTIPYSRLRSAKSSPGSGFFQPLRALITVQVGLLLFAVFLFFCDFHLGPWDHVFLLGCVEFLALGMAFLLVASVPV